jgi:putative NADPH-quinone reductase
MPKRLTLAQAEKTGRGHPEWEAMNRAERRKYVRQVNEAIVAEAKAQAYFDSFKPKGRTRKK